MIIRKLKDIKGTEREVRAPNGNWASHRFLLENDGMGFSFHDTTISAGTSTLIHYKHHLEAVYCIEGEGEIELVEGGENIPVSAGTFYGLDRHEKHYLVARTDMRIICVFNPPLTGSEVHREDGSYPPPATGKKKEEKLKFAYLNLREQPRGNYMLDCLIRAGLEPSVVIEEDSSLARKGRDNLTSELQKIAPEVPLPPPLTDIIGSRNIPRIEVANHNDGHCEEILKELQPDLIVLGDTRIIQLHIINIPAIGVVNVHPGYLPDVRGNNPYIWAIIHDLPQGCTVHFIDQDIDTGPIILRRMICPQQRWSYPALLVEINRVCGELLVEAMHYIRGGMMRGIPQHFLPPVSGESRVYNFAPSNIKDEAIVKLERGATLPKK